MTQPKSMTPIGEDAAAELISLVGDEVTENLLKLCLARARMRFMKRADQSDESWLARLPTEPFDMGFFVSVLAESLSNHAVLERILQGESIAAATGWDYEDT